MQTNSIRYNLTLLTDFYELTMANGFLNSNRADQIAYFDMFFRKTPDDGGLAIMAGVEQLVEYLENLSFTNEDIEFLRAKNLFSEDFLSYLLNFKFSCDVWAVPEGTPVFPYEPILTVRGPIIQSQFIESITLLSINHQTLIATKANRMVRAAGDRAVIEYGSRRAHGYDAAIFGARASYIGGCKGTSCTIADKKFGIPAMGTMAHSWVQLFDSEYEAFKTYAREYPQESIFLVDTYNTIKSGIPNAIRVFNEELVPNGTRPLGIRIDSGDITYLSKKARKMLDEAGFNDCKITASNSLDEYIIRDMILQGACVDVFGVGERLITASSDPIFSGVYKLSSVEIDKKIIPRIKVSDNVSKITNPCFKKLWRLYDRDSGKAIADVMTLRDEVIDDTAPYVIFDPDHIWKRKTVENFSAKELQVQLFSKGNKVYSSPDIKTIRSYCEQQIGTIWDEVLRFENPHKYYVDLSQPLWDEKQRLLSEYSS
ncbi:MAG: nicotinate phosphoribosyltransferase [Oscillospiraceae bacterium]|nr:nicotinate phosphoribosyltransferase [Oscillospiraceae bacterium]MDD3833396.1 nicotinate phosphoribosyltransferase [Oscillospiraceae bacterium]MDD4546549.1 nicotinate phosphoribosyltransferase [Oscillospiraceae bacterium]